MLFSDQHGVIPQVYLRSRKITDAIAPGGDVSQGIAALESLPEGTVFTLPPNGKGYHAPLWNCANTEKRTDPETGQEVEIIRVEQLLKHMRHAKGLMQRAIDEKERLLALREKLVPSLGEPPRAYARGFF